MMGFIWGASVTYLLALILMMDAVDTAEGIDDDERNGATLFVFFWPWEAVLVIFHKLTGGRFNGEQ